MSWMPGWKRQVDTFHLVLGYGDESAPSSSNWKENKPVTENGSGDAAAASCKYRIQVDWSTGEEDEAVALRLQSQLMVTLPPPHDSVEVRLNALHPEADVGSEISESPSLREWGAWNDSNSGEAEWPNSEHGPEHPSLRDQRARRSVNYGEAEGSDFRCGPVKLFMTVHKHREPLRVVSLSRTLLAGGTPTDGLGILTRVLDPGSLEKVPHISVTEELLGYTQHWKSLTTLSLAGCALTAVPPEIARLPMLERLYLENNKIATLPPELGILTHLRVLRADHNLINSLPIDLRQCMNLVELSLEHNRLVRPLLDFRSMVQLRTLRLFGNPLEFFPEILPCVSLRHLTLANVRIESDTALTSVDVSIASEAPSYFGASKHKLSAFFALIFRYSSVHHPLLASALARIAEDSENRAAIGKDESAIRQIVSMVLSDTQHVVEQACLALSALAADTSVVLRLMKADVLQAVTSLLRSQQPEILVSVLRVVGNLALSSDHMSSNLLMRDTVAVLMQLCSHFHILVQRQALLAVGNLAFCVENRQVLLATPGLRDQLLNIATASRATSVPDQMSPNRAAKRVLAILGENEYLRRATRGQLVGRRGVRVLAMDGGGMRGMATVQMLRQLEAGTGRQIHELFDLVCGTSTGGMLAVALGVKHLSLDQCDEVYKTLGKLVFAHAEQATEQTTWREKLDQLYKSSSQNIRVMVHGSKHNAEEFERLLKEMAEEEEDGLLIDSATQAGPKVFAVATLVSVNPATPFVFRNYQYPPGTPEAPTWTNEGPTMPAGTSTSTPVGGSKFGPRKATYVGSCKFKIWEAIRASSAAPYYLDDFASGGLRWQDGAIVANNPSVIAVREARQLWPNNPIDCIISLGCGQVPSKVRGKGGWRIADTGQVLVESACSVERSEEALDTFLPLIPDINYFRFNPIDDRCGMELDETDPVVWKKLEAATKEYVETNQSAFDNACRLLLSGLPEGIHDADAETSLKTHQFASASDENSEGAQAGKLGFRRGVLLVEGRRSPEVPKPHRHTRALEKHCERAGIHLSVHIIISSSDPAPDSASPVAAPATNGAFPRSQQSPSSPVVGKAASVPSSPPLNLTSAHGGPHSHSASPQLGFRGSDLATPPLRIPSLDLECLESTKQEGLRRYRSEEIQPSAVQGGPFVGSPHWVAPLRGQNLPPPALELLDDLQKLVGVGIVHLVLHCDLLGLVLKWRSDIIAVPQPSEMAEAFVSQAASSLRESRRRSIRAGHPMPAIGSLASLVAFTPHFTVGRDLHRFLGRHTQVLADGTEAGAYIFRRTRPAAHLTPDDARWMVGAWRDRIIICSGPHTPCQAFIDALLDSGARAVIVPRWEVSQSHVAMRGEVDCKGGNGLQEDAGPTREEQKFVIQDEGEENNEHGSEDSVSDLDEEEGWNVDEDAVKQADERDLALFLASLYDGLCRGNLDPSSALKAAMNIHQKQHWRCLLPKS